MSLLVFVEDIFSPEVTALTLKTSIFFLKPVLQRHLLSSLYKSDTERPGGALSVASVTPLIRNICC